MSALDPRRGTHATVFFQDDPTPQTLRDVIIAEHTISGVLASAAKTAPTTNTYVSFPLYRVRSITWKTPV